MNERKRYEDTSSARLQASEEGVRRFRDASFGVSVHWGIYALPGRGEWVMHQERIPVSEYEKLARRFNPVRFDAEEWIGLVKESGAHFFMITAKHHDGFCMYDSALTDYRVTRSPFGRDPVAELAEACHRRGIGLHFYYSLLDWHHPAYRKDWTAYRRYYQGQVKELCSRYGKIAGMLFDGYWPKFEFPPEREYFLPGGLWDLAGTYDLIHSLQPDAVIVNNHHLPPGKGEDYQIWELDFPGENTLGFNTTEIGDKALAVWFNVNSGWAFHPAESKVKPPAELIRLVTESRKRKATCILNAGPSPEGEIVGEEKEALRGLGPVFSPGPGARSP
jgi:alpha-L-fucosidase